MQMKFPGATGPEPRQAAPSLWDALAERMTGRTQGLTLLAVVAGLWLALMSWVVTDPSFTNFTGTTAKNWMGAPGAILSDLLLQTLGLASVLALLAPMLWALELIAREKVEALPSKLMLYPVSLILLAGAFSALPAGDSWPLYNGLGGILGDIVSKSLAGLLGLVKSNHTDVAAGILLTAFGLPALGHSTGLAMHDLANVFRRKDGDTDDAETGTSWYAALKARGK